jgi:sterol desaturase/sphingolipid hydroxylase (fatty acid hydroxylase superfamily)
LDDLLYGKRNKRGDWTPNEPSRIAPIFVWPWSLAAFLEWLPGYFLPWNVCFIALATAVWFFATPSLETMRTLAPGWIAFIWVRNMAIVLAVYGSLELWLYAKRRQSGRFKYNGHWPSDRTSKIFLFQSQNVDNFIRSFGTGIPIWTAYEVLILHAWANGWGPWTTFAAHPIWLAAFALVLPLYHEAHFYCIHRLIHVPFLYKHVHSVHHHTVNPSPWSSLSMHPVEHLLYWSDSLIHLLLPSHPLLLLYGLQITGTGAVVGHVGFDKIETGANSGVNTHSYTHYLHHKYFEVNYGDGAVPLDKWFGTWHDGSEEGDRLMNMRFEAKRARMNAKT